MWRSGDEDELQNQRSGVQMRVRGVNKVWDRDRVRAGDGRVILFKKHPPAPPKKWKNQK